MSLKTFFLFTFLLLSSFFMGAGAQQVEVARKTISGDRFERLMKKKNAVVVDVRTAEEYNAGHLPGALHIDVLKDDFTLQIQPLNKKENVPALLQKRTPLRKSIKHAVC